jgi:hypothetical protein
MAVVGSTNRDVERSLRSPYLDDRELTMCGVQPTVAAGGGFVNITQHEVKRDCDYAPAGWQGRAPNHRSRKCSNRRPAVSSRPRTGDTHTESLNSSIPSRRIDHSCTPGRSRTIPESSLPRMPSCDYRAGRLATIMPVLLDRHKTGRPGRTTLAPATFSNVPALTTGMSRSGHFVGGPNNSARWAQLSMLLSGDVGIG